MEKRKKYIDVTMTEERVVEIIKEQIGSAKVISLSEDQIREIVQDELANWHIQKPPVTRDEIAEATSEGGTFEELPMSVPKPETWRQRAKVLGIPLHKEPTGSGMRKKEDVLADMARLGEPPIEETDAQIPEELRTEEQG